MKARQDTEKNSEHGLDSPLNEVVAVLVLDAEHLLVHLFHRHAAPEDGGDGEVAAVARVAGSHHVREVEHLLRQLGNRQRPGVEGWDRTRSAHLYCWLPRAVSGAKPGMKK